MLFRGVSRPKNLKLRVHSVGVFLRDPSPHLRDHGKLQTVRLASATGNKPGTSCQSVLNADKLRHWWGEKVTEMPGNFT